MTSQSLSKCPHCGGEYRNVQQHIKYVHPEHWDTSDGPLPTQKPTNRRNTITGIKDMLLEQNEMLMLMKINRDLRADLNGETQKEPLPAPINPLELFQTIQKAQQQAIHEDRERIRILKEEIKLESGDDDDFEKQILKNFIGGAIQNANTNPSIGGHTPLSESNQQPTQRTTQDIKTD